MSGPRPPIRLGLIGLGRWGRNLIKTIDGIAGAVLARSATRDWRELTQARDLDGVIIAAPAGLHAEMAQACISAGLPALIEKPLALNLAEAQELLANAERSRAIVRVDHTYLFHPAYQALKAKFGDLGPVLAIRSAGGNWGPFRGDTTPLWDYGPHDIALCLDLMGGKPAKVQAAMKESRLLPEGRGEIVDLTLSFPGGATAQLSVGNIMPEKIRRFEAGFAAGTLVFDDLAPEQLTLRSATGGITVLPIEQGLPLTRAVEAFVKAIKDDDRSLDSLRLGVDVVEVLNRCHRASQRPLK